MTTFRELLPGVVDYAGTYAPASLTPHAAVAEYRRALASRHAWMLGRLVWPAGKLDALQALTSTNTGAPWRVSAVIGSEVEEDIDLAIGFAVTSRRGFVVETIELKAVKPGDIERVSSLDLGALVVYAEVPSGGDPTPLLRLVKQRGWHAKLRTGGIATEAFPAAAAVLRFLARCLELNLQLKATAGLHHPLRGKFPLTYEPDCKHETMYGFLNVLLAIALLEAGDSENAAFAIEETEADSIVVNAQGVRYRDRQFGADLNRVRARFHSFGSCSFREPVDDLTRLGLLQ